MSDPSIHLTWPTTFSLFPEPLPQAVPPPVKERSLRSPSGINTDLYNFALRPEIPFTFAALYIVAVFALNAYNRNRDWKAWWISKTKGFAWFVVVHNVVLALYSFATCAAMTRAIAVVWPSDAGLNSLGTAKVADALCKMHGPRGLGDAATYNTTINIWEIKNTLIHLGYNGNPDPTDVGRMWNEGLAFWGWIFYVSKFYEVIDTLIILAKGKRSATLQTYHHAGAMLCMWAGIRYMSPPIWMFVWINSGIHAMMYLYFTLSALGFKVPVALKRTLTSMQIAQFVIGASFAAVHLFVAYDIPISTPYQVVHSIQRAASSASSVATSATSVVSEFVESPTIVASLGGLIKRFLLRAAGDEGVAERVDVDDQVGLLPGSSQQDSLAHVPQQVGEKIQHWVEQRFETHYRTDWTRVNCIDTSGEAFAIYLNLLYLLPLTWLFARFFIKAYTQRGKAGRRRRASVALHDAAEALRDAKRSTESAVEDVGEKGEIEMLRKQEELQDDVKAVKEGTYGDGGGGGGGGGTPQRRVSERVQSFEGKMKDFAEKTKDEAKRLVMGSGRSSRRSSPSKKVGEAGKEGEGEGQDAKSQDQQNVTQNGDSADSQSSRPEPEVSPKDGSADTATGAANQEGDEESDNKENEPPVEKDEAEPEEKGSGESERKGNGEPEKKGNGELEKKGNGEPEKKDNAEPEAKQDETIADSQAVRPAPEDAHPSSPAPDEGSGEKKDEDTDAMGKSGSIIDYEKEDDEGEGGE